MAHVPGLSIKPQVKLPTDPSACWTWLGPVNPDGRATKTFCGKSMPAQRWMWQQLFGAIPAGMVVYTTCGNKACINPHHLRMGYQADANRQASHVTLTPEDVRALRLIASEDRTPQRASVEAMQLGVNAAAVRAVWRGSTWGRRKKNHGPRPRRVA